MTEKQDTGKPTKGPWTVETLKVLDSLELDCGVYYHKDGQAWSVCRAPRYASEQQWIRDAHLIAEAGTVYHETGMGPRELKDKLASIRFLNEQLASEHGVMRVAHNALAARVAELEKGLREHGQHSKQCLDHRASHRDHAKDCLCGLRALLGGSNG